MIRLALAQASARVRPHRRTAAGATGAGHVRAGATQLTVGSWLLRSGRAPAALKAEASGRAEAATAAASAAYFIFWAFVPNRGLGPNCRAAAGDCQCSRLAAQRLC